MPIKSLMGETGDRGSVMKYVYWIAALLIVGSAGLGCASTQTFDSGFEHTIRQGDGVIAYLICEQKVPEGETKPKKVCREAREGESPKSDEEGMVLYCEEREGKPVCSKQEGIECEYRSQTGTRIPKLHCIEVGDKEERALRDQKELDRALMQSH
jgi:hypothetical protein